MLCIFFGLVCVNTQWLGPLGSLIGSRQSARLRQRDVAAMQCNISGISSIRRGWHKVHMAWNGAPLWTPGDNSVSVWYAFTEHIPYWNRNVVILLKFEDISVLVNKHKWWQLFFFIFPSLQFWSHLGGYHEVCCHFHFIRHIHLSIKFS